MFVPVGKNTLNGIQNILFLRNLTLIVFLFALIDSRTLISPSTMKDDIFSRCLRSSLFSVWMISSVWGNSTEMSMFGWGGGRFTLHFIILQFFYTLSLFIPAYPERHYNHITRRYQESRKSRRYNLYFYWYWMICCLRNNCDEDHYCLFMPLMIT